MSEIVCPNCAASVTGVALYENNSGMYDVYNVPCRCYLGTFDELPEVVTLEAHGMVIQVVPLPADDAPPTNDPNLYNRPLL